MAVKTVILPVHILFISLLLSLITSCGGGGGDSSITQPPSYTPLTVPVSSLTGDPTSLAIDHTVNVNAITGIAPADIETDPATGVEFALTDFQIRLTEKATVGEVNDLLAALNGEIISMFEGATFLLIRIPNPGGLSMYNQIITNVESNIFVEHVSPGYFPAIRELPDNHDVKSNNVAMIGHQLAVGGHAAWHVRHLADMSLLPPHLIIADAFGDGTPDSAFNISSTGASHFNTGNPQNHGYGVLGVMLSAFTGDTSNRGLQSGIYPGALSVTGIDLTQTPVGDLRLMFAAIEDLIIHHVKSQLGKPTIVNTSIGFPCKELTETNSYCVDSWARDEGFDWLQKVRLNGLENKFIHITAAGNISTAATSNTQAMYDSPFAAARLIGDFEHNGTPISPLENTLTVESLVHSDAAPYKAACLSEGSKYHGDIAAIGHWVSSLTAPSDITGSRFYSGTSFAAPQVAGVAAYIWAIDPTLTASSVIGRINGTTRAGVSGTTTGCSGQLSARVLDAYYAVLSTDTSLSPFTLAPVRSELMDVADAAGAPGRNGKFDEEDLQLLKTMYELQNGELDYSRYDLNGDGHTGGAEAVRFDLDLDAAFSTVSQRIGDSDINFSEEGVSDADIMCYYAYSELYTGNTNARDNIIGSMCGKDDCVYQETYSGPGEFIYRKYCWSPEPVRITYEHIESNNFSNIVVTKETCQAPIYITDPSNYECPEGSVDMHASVRYGYNGWVNESAIILYINYAAGIGLWTDYICDDYGTLRDGGTGLDIGEYGDLASCHTALKTYIPGDPTVFENPGDCHAWWDHGTTVCKK